MYIQKLNETLTTYPAIYFLKKFIRSLTKNFVTNKRRQIAAKSGPGAKLKILERRKLVVDIVRPNIEDITIANGRFGTRFSIPSMLGIDKKGMTTKKPKAVVELVMTRMAVKFKQKL